MNILIRKVEMIKVIANKPWPNVSQDNCPKCGGVLTYLAHANSFFVLQVEYYCFSCQEVVLVFPDEANAGKHEELERKRPL